MPRLESNTNPSRVFISDETQTLTMADAPAIDDPLPSVFPDDLALLDDYLSFDLDSLGFTFDDQVLNSAFDDSHHSNPFDLLSSDSDFNNFVLDPVTARTESNFINQGSDGYGFRNAQETADPVAKLEDSPSELRNENPASSHGSAGSEAAVMCPSPDSGSDSGRGFVNETVNPVTEAENPASSHGSVRSEGDVMCPSPESGNSVVNMKRKNESCLNSESRTVKQKKTSETCKTTEDSDVVNEIDEKRKARLIRNRESAQLSRQRKKHYVEELEDKVKAMQATIHDLNARISFFAAENAALKQQMASGGATGGGVGVGANIPPVMYPPYPMAPYGYPWMPCPPYVVKPQGSQVPLVPIPRLKPKAKPELERSASVQKPKKDVKTKTKKVASISFIGLLLFIVLFGALVPIMNVKFGPFGGVRVSVTDGDYPAKLNDYKVYSQQHHGRVLTGDEHGHGHGHGHVNGSSYNASEPLVASLYVPRNNKLVKIDGSLIISSVLASEKALAYREEQGDTSLVPAIPVQTVKYRTSSGHHQRALPSNKEHLQSTHGDGKLQQWFREGLSGLMLSSGMCTEVFQFDTSASASGAIVPATSVINTTTTETRHNTTYITTLKNRRILHSLPIPLSNSTTNITKEHVAGHDSTHEDRHKHSSMVVSVLVDPREAGDGGDLDGGMMGGGGKGKSFSRIFVVVLLDSVKYVTYSCMLPLKGTTSHLS